MSTTTSSATSSSVGTPQGATEAGKPLVELRWTTPDLDIFPEPLDGTRYEIIDGELKVSRQPTYGHQRACRKVTDALNAWSSRSDAGEAVWAPGLIFADDQNVAPDVIWLSTARLQATLGEDGHFHAAPELVVEVLSPGEANAERDRGSKLALYGRQGVQEYWIVDWQERLVDVYRAGPAPAAGSALRHAATLGADDTLTTPLLPGFAARVSDLTGGR